jgi:hypothetical protein
VVVRDPRAGTVSGMHSNGERPRGARARRAFIDLGDLQFLKTPQVLRAIGLPALGKTEAALAELRSHGLGLTPDTVVRQATAAGAPGSAVTWLSLGTKAQRRT